MLKKYYCFGLIDIISWEDNMGIQIEVKKNKHSIETRIVFIMIMFLSLFGCYNNVYAADNPYPATYNWGSGTTLNCTWYAWQRAYVVTGVALPAWGNAVNWYTNAKNSGYSVGSSWEPRAHSIAVFGGNSQNSLGHVAFVESVSGDTVNISEGGWLGNPHERFLSFSLSSLQNKGATGNKLPLLGFIYLESLNMSWSDYQCTPSETSAYVYEQANPGTSGTFTEAGLTVWDSNGNEVAKKTESINTHGSYLKIWYKITDDTGVSLRSGATYTYQLYTVFNGTRYENQRRSFDTISTDKTNPTIDNVKVYDITYDGYTVSCTAKDNERLNRVEFPTWTAKTDASGNEQDDLQSPWPQGTQSGDTFTYRVKRSEHNNESGIYRTHVYAFDQAGNSCCVPIPEINSRAVYQPAKIIEKAGHVYAIYNDAFNRNDAKVKAESFGGHLATITNDSEQAVIDELIKGDGDAQYNGSYWLGGYKEGTTWKWDTGETISNFHWASGQPDGSGVIGSNADGLTVFTGENTGKWDDDNTSVSRGFIVEFENISAGSSVTFNGKKYTRFDIGLPWEVAQVYCQSQGGQLATVNSSDIQKKIVELISGGRGSYFIGASNVSGSWKWCDDGTVNYSNWSNGEPNNFNGIESYAEINGDKWNDISGNYETQKTTEVGFICETVATEVTQISLNNTQITLTEGGTDTITATVNPENAENKTITWSSANPDVATVDESGKITAVSKGTTVITATSSNGKQATCTVTVNGEEDTNALKIEGACNPTQVRPGGTATITINLKNYDISSEEIASMQVEVPGTTDQLTYVTGSRTAILASGEFSDTTEGNTVFAYLPFSEGENILPKTTTGLFSFQVKVSDKITADTDVQLPVKVTIGNKNDEAIIKDATVNITVSVRMKVIKKGDLNNDGSVDIMDARKAKRAAMKSVVLTADELESADLDGDGVVSIIEARKIKRAAMKIITLE